MIADEHATTDNGRGQENEPDPHAGDYISTLLSQHAKLIRASAIADNVARGRGYRSLTVKAEVVRHGFSERQAIVPALLIPIWNAFGELGTYQLRPDSPRVGEHGRPNKYETPRRGRLCLDVPLRIRDKLGDPAETLWITEGARKVDSAISRGLVCIGVMGVSGWRGRNDHDGLTALADWEAIALNGRTVNLAFDSDVMVKRAVAGQLTRLARFLEAKGAVVQYVYLPPGPNGAKVGLDDFFSAGRTVLDLHACVETEPRHEPAAEEDEGPYVVHGGRLCVRHVDDDRVDFERLADFDAAIVRDVRIDDGATVRREFVIVGRLWDGTALPEARVGATRFASMGWVADAWGVRANVAAGFSKRDKLREAIQARSRDAEIVTEYARPGWLSRPDGWAFLTAGACIGPAGAVRDLAVRLDGQAALLALPDPPDRDALIAAIRAILALRQVGAASVVAACLGAVFRAPLAEISYPDFVLWLVGKTGRLKTELAALVQRFFGPTFERKRLPASWGDTANSIERTVFDYKDVVCVVDDFAPPAGRDGDKYHEVAARVIRSAGNQSGRGRMDAAGGHRPLYVPRGLVLGTGEDLPRGHSILARMVVVEIGPGAVNGEALRAYQPGGAHHEAPALAMAGYLRWLAARFDDLRARFPAKVAAARDRFAAGGPAHRRTPDAFANLAVGWQLFLDFAADVGAIGAADRASLDAWATTALRTIVREQAGHQTAEDPAARFLELVRGSLAAGLAHIARPDGGCPRRPLAWGWRECTVGTGDRAETRWEAQGECIGWVAADDVYLEPAAAYAVANRLGREAGGGVPVTAQTLWKRLKDAGALKSWDANRQTLKVRRTIGESRREVIHLAAEALAPTGTGEPDQPAQSDREAETDPESSDASARDGRVAWSGFEQSRQNPTTQPDHEPGGSTGDSPVDGQVGRVGRVLPTGAGPGARDTAGAPSGRRCYACHTPLPVDGTPCRTCHPRAAAYQAR